jgi:parallel beta-helix repeat protein
VVARVGGQVRGAGKPLDVADLEEDDRAQDEADPRQCLQQNERWSLLEELLHPGLKAVDLVHGHRQLLEQVVRGVARVGGRGPGIILSSGSDNLVYNNLIWGNTRGIHVDYGAVNAKVYNNTLYANRDEGILVGQGSQGAVVQNNILYQNLGPSLVNSGGGTLQDHNLIDIDPRFVSASAADFRLRADSPAINVGRAISLVAMDFADIPRPHGGQYDIGAFEYGIIDVTSPPSFPVSVP